jgi:hypothetical protein
VGSCGVRESQAERASHGDFDNRLLPQSDTFGQPRSAATEWLPGCPWTRLSGPDFDTSGACEGSLDPAPVCTSSDILLQPTPALGDAGPCSRLHLHPPEHHRLLLQPKPSKRFSLPGRQQSLLRWKRRVPRLRLRHNRRGTSQ